MHKDPLTENDELVRIARTYFAHLSSQPLPRSLERGAPTLGQSQPRSWPRRTAISLIAFAAFAAVLALIVVGVGHSLSTRIGSSTTPTPAASTSTPAASPPPGGPVPSALGGDWQQQTTGRLPGSLILDGNNYELHTSGGVTVGMVVVNGSEIDFFNGDRCGIHLPGGVGRYQWSVQGGVLRFTVLTIDPCGGRYQPLANETYTKKS